MFGAYDRCMLLYKYKIIFKGVTHSWVFLLLKLTVKKKILSRLLSIARFFFVEKLLTQHLANEKATRYNLLTISDKLHHETKNYRQSF